MRGALVLKSPLRNCAYILTLRTAASSLLVQQHSGTVCLLSGPAGRYSRHQRQQGLGIHHRCRAATGPSATQPRPPGLLNRTWSNSPEELQALDTLQHRLRSLRLNPSPDRDTQIWFLRDRSLEVEETLEKLTAMTHWRRTVCPEGLQAADVAAEAATGKVVLHQHTDKFSRPVIVIKAALHRKGEWPLNDSERLCAYVIESALRQLPEGCESLLGIFDLRGFGPSNADFDFFYFMAYVSAGMGHQVDVLFTYYPKRVSQVLLVEAPWVFRPIYAAVRPALGKYASIVSFISQQELCPEYFAADTLPDAFRESAG